MPKSKQGEGARRGYINTLQQRDEKKVKALKKALLDKGQRAQALSKSPKMMDRLRSVAVQLERPRGPEVGAAEKSLGRKRRIRYGDKKK